MSWERLRLVTPPAEAPLSLDEAKAYLNVDHDDADDTITALIDATAGYVDGPTGIGVAMAEQTWKLTLDRFSRFIAIPLGPVIEIVEVEFVAPDGAVTVLAADQYRLAADQSPALLTPVYGATFPATRCEPGAVRITFKAGFDETPADLIAALKLILAALYDNRTGEPPPAARAILNRYAVIAPA